MKKAFALTALLATAACFPLVAQDGAEPDAERHAPAKDLLVDFMPAKTEVVVGEDVAFTVRDLNTTGRDVKINEPAMHYESVFLKARYKTANPPRKAEEKKDTDKKADEVKKEEKKPEEEKPLTPEEMKKKADEEWNKLTEFEIGKALGRKRSQGTHTFTREYSFPTFVLKPHRSVVFSGSIPAVKVGEMRLKAVFVGKNRERFESKEPVTVKILPDGENTDVTALVKTALGEIEVQFYPEEALNTALNFIQLARDKAYDQLSFHQIDLKHETACGGDPAGNGTGGPNWQIRAEFSNNVEHDKGTISMFHVKDQPDSAGSAFFFSNKKNPDFDDAAKRNERFTVFGKALSGLDVIEKLVKVPVARNTQAYKDKVAAIRASADQPQEKQRKLAELEKTADQPVERVEIVGVTLQKKKIEAPREEPAQTEPVKEDGKKEENK